MVQISVLTDIDKLKIVYRQQRKGTYKDLEDGDWKNPAAQDQVHVLKKDGFKAVLGGGWQSELTIA